MQNFWISSEFMLTIFVETNRTKYSEVDQVKFVEDNL